MHISKNKFNVVLINLFPLKINFLYQKIPFHEYYFSSVKKNLENLDIMLHANIHLISWQL
jgi:hypothetical protein